MIEAAAEPIAQHDAEESLAVDFQAFDPRAHVELAPRRVSQCRGGPDFTQRYPGNKDFVGLRVAMNPSTKTFRAAATET